MGSLSRLVRRIGLLLCLSILVFAAGCRTQSPCFLWKVQSPSATAYLLGSIHLGDDSLQPLDPTIEEAFARSDTLVVEVHLTPKKELQTAFLAMKKGMYPAGETLPEHLSPATRGKLEAYLKQRGHSIDAYNMMRPWLLGLTLVTQEYTRLGYKPEQGLDAYFVDRAGERTILELETAEQQLDMLAYGDNEVQDLALGETLNQIDEADSILRGIIEKWRNGDADGVDAIMRESESNDPRLEELHKRLIDDRNVEMAKKIAGYLQTNRTYFVVVGCGHLPGQKGIVQLLENEQFKVKQLSKAGKPEGG